MMPNIPLIASAPSCVADREERELLGSQCRGSCLLMAAGHEFAGLTQEKTPQGFWRLRQCKREEGSTW